MQPHKLYIEHVSDHSPVMFTISSVAIQKPAHRCIPSWVTSSDLFKQCVSKVVHSRPEFASSPPTVSIAVHKQIIKETAAQVRDVLLKNTSKKDAQCTLLHSVSGAVFHEDLVLASHLANNRTIAPTHLLISNTTLSYVCLDDLLSLSGPLNLIIKLGVLNHLLHRQVDLIIDIAMHR